MNVLAVENETYVLDEIRNILGRLLPRDASVKLVSKASEAVRYISSEGADIDVCCIDSELKGFDSLNLARLVRSRNPAAVIVFCASFGFSSESIPADIGCAGIVCRPVTEAKIRAMLAKTGVSVA